MGIEDRNDRIVILYTTTDRTLADIGEEFGVSGEAIRKLMKKMGVERRKPVPSPQQIAAPALHDEVLRLAREGVSGREIAARLGYSHSSVANILRESGLSFVLRIDGEQRSRLRELYGAVPEYRGVGRHVVGTREGRALVEYIAQLRRDGYQMTDIAENGLGMTRIVVGGWLVDCGYQQSGEPLEK